ncbi:MAG TPA: hypothetical protein VG742_13450 [Dongiaceae bacterium]|nr:hypothetical protein [Dongiaceae bacterium]
MLKLNLLTMALLLSAAGGGVQAQTATTASESVVGVPGCHFGEVIDGTTADDAKRHIEAAGYTNVVGLKKSCDNYWHGQALVNGTLTRVSVTPDGRVRLEND